LRVHGLDGALAAGIMFSSFRTRLTTLLSELASVCLLQSGLFDLIGDHQVLIKQIELLPSVVRFDLTMVVGCCV
jgi:hypothetical protein